MTFPQPLRKDSPGKRGRGLAVDAGLPSLTTIADQSPRLLSGIRGRVLLVLDSCFSGGFSKDVISSPRRMGLFSSEEDVTSGVADKFRAGGYLAKFMAEAIGERRADKDRNGEITAIELSQYLHERYRADVQSSRDDETFVRTGGPQTGYQHRTVRSVVQALVSSS